jgi:hypothetical protein
MSCGFLNGNKISNPNSTNSTQPVHTHQNHVHGSSISEENVMEEFESPIAAQSESENMSPQETVKVKDGVRKRVVGQ